MKRIFFLLFIFSTLLLHAQTNSRGVSVVNKDSSGFGGTIYAVIVGISGYKYIKPLSFADQDALLFQHFLESKAGGSVKADDILLILNENANASTQPRIRHWLSGVKNPQKGDRVYFYFAGHGDAINQDEYFFLLQDCDPAGDKNNYTGGMASVLQMYNIKSFIKNDLLGKGVDVVLIWDACRTNELPGGTAGLKIIQESMSEKSNGELIMLSASAGEVAIENNAYAHGHGLFTYYLIDGLSGVADNPDEGGNNDGKVDIAELDTWVKMQVRKDAQIKFHTSQNPRFAYTNSNEILASVDSSFKEEWVMTKQQKDDIAINYSKNTGRGMQASDSEITKLYNQFMFAVKNDSLNEGEYSAEVLYSKLLKKYPGQPLTEEAGFNLAMEYINLAQDKLNIYLSGKDREIIVSQHIDPGVTHNLSSNIREAAMHNFSTHAHYLERAMSLLKNYPEIDSEYLEQLQAKADFLLARGYYSNEGEINDFSVAMQLAKKALQAKPDVAYNNLLLGLLYSQAENYDSSSFYEHRALALAPEWTAALVSLAADFCDRKFFDSATIYCRKAININPKYNVIAYYNLGVIFYNQSMYDSAITYYRAAIDIDLKFAWTYFGLGLVFANQNMYDSAITYYRKAIDIDPKYAEAYNNLGIVFKDQNMYDSAITYYRKAIDIDPKYAYAHNNLGVVFKDQDMYDSAITYYRKAIDIDPKYAYAHNNLGIVFYNQNMYDSAIIYYRKAIDIDPKYAYAYNSFGIVFDAQNMYDSAITYYRAAIDIDPEYVEAYNNLGIVFKDQNIYDSAIMYYRKAIDIDPKYVDAYYCLGIVFANQNLYDSAITYYRAAIDIDPKDEWKYIRLGDVFKDQNMDDSAITYYRAAIDIVPKYANAYYNLGVIFKEQKMYDSAIMYYRKAIDIDPKYVNAYYNLGVVFKEQKMYDSAITYYRKAIDIAPKYANAYYNLGVVFKEQNMYDSAITYYHAAIDIAPKYANAYYNLGVVFKEQNMYDSAISYYHKYRKVIGINPKYAGAYINLGTIFKEQNMYDSAISYYRKAIDINPKYVGAYINLGVIFKDQNMYDSAITYYRAAIDIDLKDQNMYDSAIIANCYYNIACIASLGNKPGKALENLEMCFKHGFKDYDHILIDTDLDNIRNTDEFKQLLKKYFQQKAE